MVEARKMHKFDSKEFELPETVFVRDIDNRLFQSIVWQCLSKIRDISLVEGNFIDNILGRNTSEGIKGITAEQDNKDQSVRINIEVNIAYGVAIPDKADEIQSKIVEEITRLTGLHVASVHVVFKGLIPTQSDNVLGSRALLMAREGIEEEYSDEFK